MSNPKVSFFVWKRKTRQIKTQARYIHIIIIFLIYTRCPFPWTVVFVKFKPVVAFIFILSKHVLLTKVKKEDLFNLEHRVIFELCIKLLSFSSTQGSEMDGFAFEQIQGMKASAKPAPKTFLIAGLWRAKRACGAPWVSKSTRPRKFGNHVTVHRPPVRPHHRATNVHSS